MLNTRYSLSAHADQGELLAWLGSGPRPRQVYLVHGEPTAQLALQQRIREAPRARRRLRVRHGEAMRGEHARERLRETAAGVVAVARDRVHDPIRGLDVERDELDVGIHAARAERAPRERVEERLVELLVEQRRDRLGVRVADARPQRAVADARRAVDFAEVVVLLLDATRGLEHQDLKIASLVLEEGRALIVAINKWDVAEEASSLFNGVRAALDDGLSQVKGLPLLSVSARTGKGLDQLIKAAFELREAWSRRVPTALLNRWFDEALAKNPPPAPGGKRIKLRYITQARIRPPSFVLFGTRLDQLPGSYERYLVNSMRKDLGFDSVPVRLTLRMPKNPFKK